MDMKLEVVVLPVSDVDRAKAFYTTLGWREDADFPGADGFRVVQLTPPGSPASVIFGSKVSGARPGSVQGLHLIVGDVEKARADLVEKGIAVSEVFHDADGVFHRAGTVPSDQLAAWSPDNTRWAYPGDDYGDFAGKAPATTQMVLDVATGKAHRMRLPKGVTGDVQWESNETLLVHVLTGPRRHFMVRCQAESGACELALRMGRTSGWSFPNQL